MFRKALAFILWIVILTTSKAYAYVDEEFDIRIPAQAVADGVKKLSHQTNRSVLFQTDQLSNTRTNAVSGRYSIEDALAALLDGTNLKGDLTESGVIVISLQKGADASHLEGTSMKRTTLQKSLLASVSALIFGTGGQAALAQDGAQEDTIVVQGTQFFDRSQSSSAAKLPLNLVETPQSVSVLNEDLIDTFAITRLNDLYKYVAGLDQRSKGSQGELFNGGVTARGFDLDVLDGFKFNGISFIPVQPVDTIVLERTEFLKGPSGIIYGRNNYGGIVNFVSKKPKDQEFAQIGAHIGNYDLYRFEADVNTPLVDDILSVRLPLAFESTNSYLEEDSKQFTAAPSILFTPTDRLTVDVSAIIQNWQSARQLGVPTYTTGTTYADVNWDEDGTTSCFQLECSAPPESISDVLFAPDWQNYEGESVQAFARVGYEFAPDWEAFISASNLSSSFYTDQYLLGTLIAENGDTGFISFLEDREDKSSSVEVGITGEFTAFGRTNQLYVGADYRTFESVSLKSFDRFLGVVPVFDFSDRYDFQDWLDTNIDRPPTPPLDQYTLDEREFYGVGVQAFLEPIENIKVLLGGRYEYATITTTNTSIGDFGFDAFDEFEDGRFLPRAAVSWLFVPDVWTLYGSYAEGYVQQTGITRSGEDIGPETGYQLEVGLKGQFFNQRLLATLAAFRIDREDVAISDPENLPGEPFVIPGLSQRNQGIELEVIGEVLPGLNIIVAGNIIDAAYNESSEEFFSGKDVGVVPEYKFSAFANYDVTSGSLEGLSIGGGFTSVGRQWAGEGEDYRLDGYTTVDANIGYAFNDGRYEIKLLAQNLFDERYFVTRGDYNGCCGSYGDGRIVRLAFGANFGQ